MLPRYTILLQFAEHIHFNTSLMIILIENTRKERIDFFQKTNFYGL